MAQKLTKKQLVSLVATKAHLPKKAAREAIDVFLAEIVKAIKKRGMKVVISGFGTFKTVEVQPKDVVVPGTQERKTVKKHWAPRFSPGKPLRKAVR